MAHDREDMGGEFMTQRVQLFGDYPIPPTQTPVVACGITVTYQLECAVCGDKSSPDARRCRSGDRLYLPSMPQGWLIFGTEPICPKHSTRMLLLQAKVNEELESMSNGFADERGDVAREPILAGG